MVLNYSLKFTTWKLEGKFKNILKPVNVLNIFGSIINSIEMVQRILNDLSRIQSNQLNEAVNGVVPFDCCWVIVAVLILIAYSRDKSVVPVHLKTS